MTEHVHDVAHIAHAELKTPRPDESLAFFVDVLGMEEEARDGQSVYLRGWGDYLRYSLKLTESTEAGIGHVALGHSKKAMQTAYTVSAARDAANAAGGATVAALSSSQLGDLTEKFINAQFSQSQESAADDYSFDQLQAKGLNTRGLVTAFQKLAELDGGKSDMMSSHPSSAKRAQHIEERIAKAK